MLGHQVLQGQVVGTLAQRVLLVRLQAQSRVRPLTLIALENLARLVMMVLIYVLGGGRWPGQVHIAKQALAAFLRLEVV